MRRTLQIATILLLCQTTVAQIITVKQDSTGDYIHIQDAIDFAQDGDTVLVCPGTYFESLHLDFKNITLGSLSLTTGDDNYIAQTIIDGENSRGCVLIEECYELVELNGFTLQHGIGFWHGSVQGGAILIRYADAKILNCIIQNNMVTGNGGGVSCNYANVSMSNVTICENHAYKWGGGIHLLNTKVEFDTVNKCNIYANYASRGTDIYILGTPASLHMVVDTFTVATPDYYYLFANKDSQPLDSITYDIQIGKIDQTDVDLYVSNEGDNNNSGLTPDDPLKNIYYALLKMSSDSLLPDTIHVKNGVYSPSMNGEKHPLSLKKHASIRGESRDSTILDAEAKTYLMEGYTGAYNYQISRLTLKNGDGNANDSPHGRGGINLLYNDETRFADVLVTKCKGHITSGITIHQSNNVSLRKVDFIENMGGEAFRAASNPVESDYADTVELVNCRFIENLPTYDDPDVGFGGGLSTLSQLDALGYMTCIINNCLFIDNYSKSYSGYGAVSITSVQGGKAIVVNSTFADNTKEGTLGANIGIVTQSEVDIYNSICFNNTPREFYMSNFQPDKAPCQLNIYNTLVDGGIENIEIYTDGNELYYDETNIDEDPMFLGKWEHPYQIYNGSPCINTGTLANLPDFIELPEFDLAGNPRIVGDSIDMGAYEWNPTVGIDKYQCQAIESEKPKLLKAAPNPFRTETTISANWDFKGHVQIEIYSNTGLRVMQLKSGKTRGNGSLITPWVGKDQFGNELPAGVYHLVMTWDGIEVENLKIIHH